MAVGDFEAKESSKLSFLLNLRLPIVRDYFLQGVNTSVTRDLPSQLGNLIPFEVSPTPRCYSLIMIIGIPSRNVCRRSPCQGLGGI
jgi:hypothetical protein